MIDGRELEQWQIEVTGGGRIWYLIDDDRRTIWVLQASLGRQKATEWLSALDQESESIAAPRPGRALAYRPGRARPDGLGVAAGQELRHGALGPVVAAQPR